MFLRNMFRPKSSQAEFHSSLNLKGVFEKRLFENKKSTVDLFYIGGSPVVVKSSSDNQSMIEHVNEAFISDTCINL